MYSQNSTS